MEWVSFHLGTHIHQPAIDGLTIPFRGALNCFPGQFCKTQDPHPPQTRGSLWDLRACKPWREAQPVEQGLSSFKSGAVAAWPSWASTKVLIFPQWCHQFSYFSCHSSNPLGGLGWSGQSSPPRAPLPDLYHCWGGANRDSPERPPGKLSESQDPAGTPELPLASRSTHHKLLLVHRSDLGLNI